MPTHLAVMSGSYACNTKTFFSMVTWEEFFMKQYINCGKSYIFYLSTCTMCSPQYVGCTTRFLKTRIGEYYRNTNNLNVKQISNVTRHIRDCHQSDLSSFRFRGIERLSHLLRGGDRERRLLGREA